MNFPSNDEFFKTKITGFGNCSAKPIGFEVDDQIEWKLSQKLPELQYSLNIETKIDSIWILKNPQLGISEKQPLLDTHQIRIVII